MIFEKIHHANHQKIIHHNIIHVNVAIQYNMFDDSSTPDLTTSNITKNSAKAVQSLNKLSHSNIKTNLLGAQNSLNSANTATGSVAEIILPNSNVIDRGISHQINLNQ